VWDHHLHTQQKHSEIKRTLHLMMALLCGHSYNAFPFGLADELCSPN
jgi:hypothetical protein